ncbi:hypothetical protein Tco_0278178 [Tanacetum coccineum]
MWPNSRNLKQAPIDSIGDGVLVFLRTELVRLEMGFGRSGLRGILAAVVFSALVEWRCWRLPWVLVGGAEVAFPLWFDGFAFWYSWGIFELIPLHYLHIGVACGTLFASASGNLGWRSHDLLTCEKGVGGSACVFIGGGGYGVAGGSYGYGLLSRWYGWPGGAK